MSNSGEQTENKWKKRQRKNCNNYQESLSSIINIYINKMQRISAVEKDLNGIARLEGEAANKSQLEHARRKQFGAFSKPHSQSDNGAAI